MPYFRYAEYFQYFAEAISLITVLMFIFCFLQRFSSPDYCPSGHFRPYSSAGSVAADFAFPSQPLSSSPSPPVLTRAGGFLRAFCRWRRYGAFRVGLLFAFSFRAGNGSAVFQFSAEAFIAMPACLRLIRVQQVLSRRAARYALPLRCCISLMPSRVSYRYNARRLLMPA